MWRRDLRPEPSKTFGILDGEDLRGASTMSNGRAVGSGSFRRIAVKDPRSVVLCRGPTPYHARLAHSSGRSHGRNRDGTPDAPRVSKQERDGALSAGCRGCGDSPGATASGGCGLSLLFTGTYGTRSGYLRWCRLPLHPFVHTSPHVFNRAGDSKPALCCIQYKSFKRNHLTAHWRGITSAGKMPARGSLRRSVRIPERPSRIRPPRPTCAVVSSQSHT